MDENLALADILSVIPQESHFIGEQDSRRLSLFLIILLKKSIKKVFFSLPSSTLRIETHHIVLENEDDQLLSLRWSGKCHTFEAALLRDVDLVTPRKEFSFACSYQHSQFNLHR